MIAVVHTGGYAVSQVKHRRDINLKISLIRNNTQTAVTNIRYKRILLEIILTFPMLLPTSSEVTVNTKLEFKYKGLLAKSDVCHRCLCVISDQTEMAKEKEY